MVDLSEASERVAVLEHFPFEDEQPNIEGASIAVLFDGNIDYVFADRGAFESRWSEENHSMAQLVRNIFLFQKRYFFVTILPKKTFLSPY